MICTFFGHRDLHTTVTDLLKREILRLYADEGVSSFYVGNNGGFDAAVQKVCVELAKSYPDFSYCVVLSRPDERPICEEACETVYPEGLESVPPRFAVSKRNEWMLRHAEVAIVYRRYRFSNTEKLVERARKRGIRVINIAPAEDDAR